MKKLIALVLATLIVFAVCGCSASEKETEVANDLNGKFSVGYDAEILTPTQSVPLSGFGNEKFRYSNEIENDVKATAVAVTDESGNSLILIALDVVKIERKLADPVRENISGATGVPKENIMLSASHSHAAVAYATTFDIYITSEYLPWMTEQVTQCGIDAFNDRAPATMYKGQIEAEGLNFVRHYMTDNPLTGETQCFGDNHGDSLLNTTTRHASDADPTMYLLQFKREGRKDIVLCNWRGHPHFVDGSTSYKVSPDYIGAFRDDLGIEMDCDVLFFQGAAGNLNTKSRIQAENKTTELHAFSKLLTDYAIDCLKNNMTEVTSHTIRQDYTGFRTSIDHSMDYLVSIASQVSSVWKSTGDRSAAMALAEGTPIQSVYHANAINWRSSNTEGEVLQLYAFCIGETVAITVAPNELFDTNSQWLEEHSPFETNIYIGYANENRLYIPSIQGFDYGCYEADITHAARGTAEEMEQTFLDMLNGFKK